MPRANAESGWHEAALSVSAAALSLSVRRRGCYCALAANCCVTVSAPLVVAMHSTLVLSFCFHVFFIRCFVRQAALIGGYAAFRRELLWFMCAIFSRWQPSLLLFCFLLSSSCAIRIIAWHSVEQTLLEPLHFGLAAFLASASSLQPTQSA